MDLIKQDIPALLGKLAGELSNLARDEVALAKIELKQTAKEAAADSAAVAGGGALVYAGLFFLLVSAMFGLSTMMPMWAAALAVGAVTCLVGGIAIAVGTNRLKSEVPDLEHTKKSLRTNGYHLKESVTQS